MSDEIGARGIDAVDLLRLERKKLQQQGRAIGIGRHGQDLVTIEWRRDRLLPQRGMAGEIRFREEPALGRARRSDEPRNVALVEGGGALVGDRAEDAREVRLAEHRAFAQRVAAGKE